MAGDLNATSSIYSLANVEPSSWGGTVIYMFLFVLFPLGMIFFAFAVLWNLANYTKFKKYLGVFQESFYYFMIGSVSLFALAIPFALLYWGYSQAKKGNILPLKYTGYAIIGYIIISFFGWIIKKYVVDRIVDFEGELKKKNKSKKINST